MWEKREGEGGVTDWPAGLSSARLGYFAVDAEVMASSTICPFDAEILHLSKLDFFHTACERKGTTNKCFQ